MRIIVCILLETYAQSYIIYHLSACNSECRFHNHYIRTHIFLYLPNPNKILTKGVPNKIWTNCFFYTSILRVIWSGLKYYMYVKECYASIYVLCVNWRCFLPNFIDENRFKKMHGTWKSHPTPYSHFVLFLIYLFYCCCSSCCCFGLFFCCSICYFHCNWNYLAINGIINITFYKTKKWIFRISHSDEQERKQWCGWVNLHHKLDWHFSE